MDGQSCCQGCTQVKDSIDAFFEGLHHHSELCKKGCINTHMTKQAQTSECKRIWGKHEATNGA